MGPASKIRRDENVTTIIRAGVARRLEGGKEAMIVSLSTRGTEREDPSLI
jgi:hypothetical protein